VDVVSTVLLLWLVAGVELVAAVFDLDDVLSELVDAVVVDEPEVDSVFEVELPSVVEDKPFVDGVVELMVVVDELQIAEDDVLLVVNEDTLLVMVDVDDNRLVDRLSEDAVELVVDVLGVVPIGMREELEVTLVEDCEVTCSLDSVEGSRVEADWVACWFEREG